MNRRTLGCLFELAETLLLTLLIFLVVQLFVAQPYQVQQSSMEDTLAPGEYVLVDKLTPNFDDYHRGDIVVFNPPAGWTQESTAPYIKRVVAIAGDVVDIHGGHVYLNGNELNEPYVHPGDTTEVAGSSGKTWRVAPGQLFVLGDHRRQSLDSRDFGPIDKSAVIGRAWLRYWPTDKFGVLPQPKETPAPSGSPAPSTRP